MSLLQSEPAGDTMILCGLPTSLCQGFTVALLCYSPFSSHRMSHDSSMPAQRIMVPAMLRKLSLPRLQFPQISSKSGTAGVHAGWEKLRPHISRGTVKISVPLFTSALKRLKHKCFHAGYTHRTVYRIPSRVLLPSRCTRHEDECALDTCPLRVGRFFVARPLFCQVP